jgi:hypothetical protein
MQLGYSPSTALLAVARGERQRAGVVGRDYRFGSRAARPAAMSAGAGAEVEHGLSVVDGDRAGRRPFFEAAAADWDTMRLSN